MKQDYWFKRKTIGYGWGLPCHPWGWVAFISYLLIFLISLLPPLSMRRISFAAAETIIFIFIVAKKGEPLNQSRE